MSRNALAGTGRKPAPVLKPLSSHDSLPIRVNRTVCLLGSHPRVHLPLQSPMISRIHAMIVVDGAETYVRDLASRNGVYINGHLARESRLRHGDLLCVGPFAFWWRSLPLPGPRPRHLHEAGPGVAYLAVAGQKSPHPMEANAFLIGSRAECDLCLENPLIDPVHAVVYRHDRKFFLRDLNSKNGTFLNSRRVREAELSDGDEIRVGWTQIRFAPPEPSANDTQTEDPKGDTLSGIEAVMNSDRPSASSDSTARSCLTIEQLLGAAPTRITQWEKPAPRTPLPEIPVPEPVVFDLI